MKPEELANLSLRRRSPVQPMQSSLGGKSNKTTNTESS